MLNKVKFFIKDFSAYFFSARLIVFLLFQGIVMHYCLDSLHSFSIAVNYPIAIWTLPFLYKSLYIQVVYGISVVYFFSTVPFFQYSQMYAVIRQGRMQWMIGKIIRIWAAAFLLTITDFFMSVLLLLPRVEFTMSWGKLFYSLALTTAANDYGVLLTIPYKIISSYTPVQATGIVLLMMFLITGMLATSMFFFSMFVSRSFAVIIATILAIMSIVAGNVSFLYPKIIYVSPFSWMNVLLLNGSDLKIHPSFMQAIMLLLGISIVLTIFIFLRVRRIDFDWIKEE